MYSQIAGCYIYGYTYYYKSYFHDSPSSPSNHPASLSLSSPSNQPSPPLNQPSSSTTATATISNYTRCKRIIYLGITTGLCGSITSFSSWQLICNNNLILQWDVTWGNSNSSYNGGRFIEWMVSLWAGIVIPVAALRFGIFTASLLSSSTSLSSSSSQPSSAAQESLFTEQHQHQPQSNRYSHIINNTINSNIISDNSNNNFQIDYNNSRIESIYDILIILMFIISLLLVTILPSVIYPQWTFLTYTAGK